MPAAPIPVTVIGGYLGAGKTTLLNRLLRSGCDANGERLAVLVNDFGSVAVDASLVESADGTTIRLSNGCVCCSLADGFVAAMETIAAIEPRPDRLVVETSGVADPAAVAEYAHLPGFALDSIVVLADAETIQTRASDPLVGRQVRGQLAGADLVVLNKVDLLERPGREGRGRIEALRSWTAGLAPDAHVVTAVEAQIDLDLLWGGAPAHRPRTIDDHAGRHLGVERDHDEHPSHPRYVAFSVDGRSTVSRELLEAAIDELTVDPLLVRVKGFVCLDDSGCHLVQVVGRRRRITPFVTDAPEVPGGAQPAVSLVVIGLADSPTGTTGTIGAAPATAVSRAAQLLARRLGAIVVESSG